MIKQKVRNIILIILLLLVSSGISVNKISAQEDWNVINKEFNNYENWRISSGGGEIPTDVIQQTNSVTIKSSEELTEENANKSRYYFLVSPLNLKFPTEDDITVEVVAKVNDYTLSQGNEISIRTAGSTDATGRIFKVFLVNETIDDPAHVIVVSDTQRHKIYTNVNDWASYKFVIKERDAQDNRKFSFYINDELLINNVNAPQMKGSDLIRMGHDNGYTSDLDIQTVRVKANVEPEITNIILDKKYIVPIKNTIMPLSIHSLLIPSNSQFNLSLLDDTNNEITSFTNETVESQGDLTNVDLVLPNTLTSGKYKIKVEYNGITNISDDFFVVNESGAPTFPEFEFVEEPILKEDHTYSSILNPNINPVEWNFPSVVDTKKTPLAKSNNLVDENGDPYRYYLFYAPHNDPGGIMMMVSQSLDGPWVDYENNPFIENSWMDEGGGYYYKSVPHVSSPDIFYNEEEKLFFVYFHGNNLTTRYATSEDLVNWTYGDIAIYAKDFASNANEASYARVYKHEIEGLDNKYVMIFMLNDTTNVRKIFWAHSKDGRNWTPVSEALASPLNAPSYIDYSSKGFNGPGANGGMSGANLSGPFLWNWQDRWYLIAHGSNGDIMAIEIGENFDQEIHWGPIYDSVKGDPDLGRAGAAVFIQDDEDTWHMFYEGGLRLRNNIMHAKESGDITLDSIVNGLGKVNLSSKTAYYGSRVDITIHPQIGHEIESVIINGENKTTDVINNVLILESVEENQTIVTTFKEIQETPELTITGLPETIYVGDSFTLEIGDSLDGTWVIDESYLSVTNNTFTVLKAGETTITYRRSDNETKTLELVIKDRDIAPTPELTITGLPETIYVGDSFTLEIGDSLDGTWVVDESYLSVTNNTFTVLKAGETTITYRRSDNKTKTLELVIKDRDIAPTPELTITGLPETIYVGDTFTLEIGDTLGGEWLYDSDYFIRPRSIAYTFTAVKEGTTSIQYIREDGQSLKLHIVISSRNNLENNTENNEEETTSENVETLPKTGISTLNYNSIVGIGFILLGIVGIKKKVRKND